MVMGRISRVWQIACVGVTLLTGCAYRFTNSSVVRPEGIRTVAVEAIYDTSREVLPHELLWEALQNAVATSGHLKLAPSKTADALLRAHVREAKIGAAGTLAETDPSERDPEPFERNTPPGPREFQTLTQAGEFRDSSTLQTVVDMEVWSLRTRTLLHKQTFTLSTQFRAVLTPKLTPRANEHLRYDEATSAAFKAQALTMAKQVMRDFLVR